VFGFLGGDNIHAVVAMTSAPPMRTTMYLRFITASLGRTSIEGRDLLLIGVVGGNGMKSVAGPPNGRPGVCQTWATSVRPGQRGAGSMTRPERGSVHFRQDFVLAVGPGGEGPQHGLRGRLRDERNVAVGEHRERPVAVEAEHLTIRTAVVLGPGASLDRVGD